MPFIPGENENFVNAQLISKMKDGVILVNTARGEILSEPDVIAALESGKISRFACDVVQNEKKLFGKKNDTIEDPNHAKLVGMFPKVLMTQHCGSATDQALIGMIETSLKNCDKFIECGKGENSLIK